MSYNIEENYTRCKMSKLHGKGRSKNIVSSYESGNVVNFYWRHVGCWAFFDQLNQLELFKILYLAWKDLAAIIKNKRQGNVLK